MKLLLLLFALSVNALQGAETGTAETLAKTCRLGDVKMAEALLSSGVDPNLPDRYGRTPLYYAALFNRDEIVDLLLADHANPNPSAKSRTAGSEFPQTPLQLAASMGNLRIASLLVRAGAHLDTQGKMGLTALHFAAIGGHLDVLRFLIYQGANFNIRDAEGTNPLDEAVWRGNLDVTAVLLAHGARLNEPQLKTGATPINEAAYQGNTRLVRYLLQFGPDLEAPDRKGYSPLENAARMGKEDAAVLLLEAEAKRQKAAPSWQKTTNTAIEKDEPTLVEALLRHGALSNTILPSGLTPLDSAACAGAAGVVRVLLNNGADPNKESRNGTSPLEDAALRGFAPVAELLLDHGARVNQINTGSGTTALYAAASFGKTDLVKLLLQRGADPHLCGKGRRSPYQAAIENGYSQIAAQIQGHGGTKSCER